MRITTTLSISALAALFALTVQSQQSERPVADGRPLVSILALMEQTITPATNTIWAYWEPPEAEEDWTRLEEAAITLLVATQANALGGTGPMDTEWVENPAWQAYNQIMLNAAVDALEAIRARDHDALLEAGDVLYPPCEACHQQFNPGVVGQQ